MIELRGGPFIPGEPCRGRAATGIVVKGQPIYVLGTDAEGAIATGHIGVGLATSETLCVLTFAADRIPGGFEQYRVVLGRPGIGILAAVEHLDARTISMPITLRVGTTEGTGGRADP